ncbi:biotin--[acetyl-CoA-carboxylase] ligase [Thermocrinis sp.]
MRLGELMVWFDEVSSTQDLVRSLPFGSVAVANRQSKGRGRLGRVWHSQEGGLYFSFLLNANDFRELSPLPLVVGYGILLLLEKKGFTPTLKWVNDVYVRGKKVCGVLVERSKEKLMVGVGINLNQKVFPEGLNATSLYLLSGKVFDNRDILIEVLERLSKTLNEFASTGFGAFKELIKERLMFLGQEVMVQTTVGIFEDIDDDGGLLLRTSNGMIKFNAGEVSLRGLYVL